ncbi:Schizosaccharomyces pombe specific protein [Schizosaccharomyces pombe]|uniref:Putative uncharacterized protein C1685.17 n=1 Tax=Schizosaccharomyces pombe (strain 972 / ATCC 24843) TaxID=284812 RepID=YH0H_SCHPO|nr:uncharacterized protein SPBC1685.17 [Schizosaccharomyces pombe]G2TRS0.1 RecName: Full=Putative uncharacterized protein C1685.17 [Schizosaccharomyces pombe 972h-]CCD31351.1 dubious [Schizosaccharomyces pombe]|eukprot:NP_001343141.1 uncharacterized protein SPBC1685.17 [Schizosaccharomyces pombe]
MLSYGMPCHVLRRNTRILMKEKKKRLGIMFWQNVERRRCPETHSNEGASQGKRKRSERLKSVDFKKGVYCACACACTFQQE